MDLNSDMKEELMNTETIKNTRIAYLKELKKVRASDKRPMCQYCMKQDWEIGEYDPNNTEKYFDLKEDKEKTRMITKVTRFGTKISQGHTHYNCPRKHGVCIPMTVRMEAMLVHSIDDEKKKEDNNGNNGVAPGEK